MTTEDSHNLPKHLLPLIQATPSGALKLIAAWDGLSLESQIAILTALEEAESTGINWWGPIYVKAVQSANAYIRYLAARRLRFGFKKDDQDCYRSPESERIRTFCR